MLRKLKAAKRTLSRLASDLTLYYRTRELDPLFYSSNYKDLGTLTSIRQLRRHFRSHGRAEGRHPNEASYFQHRKELVLRSPDTFDVSAYKYYNKDLLQHLGSDEEFLEHYVRHGMEEGRLCRFPAGQNLEQEVEVWEPIFAPADVLAWAGERVQPPPTSKRELVAAFKNQGIDELWPANLGYVFDPPFYAATYGLRLEGPGTAVAAYRHFLDKGFRKGHAPNEAVLLRPYLGGAPYPELFDWAGYAAAVQMSGKPSRIRSLEHIFEADHQDFAPFIKFMGDDASDLLGRIGAFALARQKPNGAIAALRTSLSVCESSPLASLLGDAFAKLGREEEAAAAYRQSISVGLPPITAYSQLVGILCRAGDFEGAFDVLRTAKPSWKHKASFYDKLEECSERFFEQRSAEAHRLYRTALVDEAASERRVEADQLLTATLNRIEQLYAEIDNLPAPTGGQADGYVVILANQDLRQCTHYRVEQKVQQLEAAGIPVRVFDQRDVSGFMDALVGARAAIFYRVPAVPKIVRAICHANAMRLATYYEIDDLIFDASCYPDPFASFEGQISEEEYAGLQFGVPLFRFAMSMCEGSIGSTSALAAWMRRVTRSGTQLVVANGLDARNRVSIDLGAEPRAANERIRIFYGSGTKAHNADFNDVVGPALLSVMQRFSHVDLVVVGHLKLRPEFGALSERVTTYPIISDLDAYWSVLASCDINLAALHPGPVADCKSEIKWLEAAVLQVPSIVSDTATYREVVQHGRDGFIAKNSDDWRAALWRLVEDGALRRSMGAEARRRALRDYSLERAAEQLRQAFSADDQLSVRSREGKLRVLVCNVFFEPQSIGGATRVVEDNIRSFLRSYDDLEIGVFCSDEGVEPPGRLRMGRFGSVPVYRLSTPNEEDMEWRPFNSENAESFGRVLDHFQPDVIHLHCIQRLTASIVEVARVRGIPYLVTLHDGWWISDHQFLVDEDGFLRLPTGDIILDTAGSRTPTRSIERRQRLRALLRGAAARLSVSEAFARVFENAGIPDLHITENGVPALPTVRRERRADGRVALAHIGGRAVHKGAALVEAAFRQERFNNLHLTMVDGHLAPGETIETRWGTTPVTLSGPYPQSRVAELYGRVDVLLAPSIWPESYGLVTREALASGLWVVASDSGAIGDGVEEDRNGYVIDTRTTAALKQVLHKMDAQPERYREAPQLATAHLRPMDAQARELHQIYWEVAEQYGIAADEGSRTKKAR